MASRRVEIDSTGETVRERIAALRKQQGLSLSGLAAKLRDLGRSYGLSSLSDIENGGRRVDVDDLVAFAQVLNVSPATLLMPPAADRNEPIAATGVKISAGAYWGWLQALRPLQGGDSATELMKFRLGAGPGWGVRIGEGGGMSAAEFEQWWKAESN